MPGIWMLSDSEISQVADYVRSLGRNADQNIPGDPKKGQQVYDKGQCATCHIINGHGGNLGPELTSIGTQRGRKYLQQAVNHPGRERPVDAEGFDQFLVVHVETRDGREVQGMRVNEDSFTIQLRDAENRFHSFRKGSLKVIRRESGKSLMPDFEESFTPTEMDDLVAFMMQLRGS